MADRSSVKNYLKGNDFSCLLSQLHFTVTAKVCKRALLSCSCLELPARITDLANTLIFQKKKTQKNPKIEQTQNKTKPQNETNKQRKANQQTNKIPKPKEMSKQKRKKTTNQPPHQKAASSITYLSFNAIQMF